MKKIALASAAMGGAALIAFGASGTFAAFTDTEQATASSGAGSLDLQVSGGQVTTAPAAMTLKPGESTQLAYWVNNVGNTNGSLGATINVLADRENWCNEPEREAELASRGPLTCDEFGGEFDNAATVSILRAAAADETTCPAATTGAAIPGVPSALLSQVNGATNANLLTIPAGTGVCFVVDVTLSPTAGNAVQGDSVDLGATLTLTQTP